MGLFIARAALRSVGGDLRFEAEPGGAVFVVELPVWERGKRHEFSRNRNN
jgi:signal transduction histidine kinase